jgi:ribosomal protein L37AE/L43A
MVKYSKERSETQPSIRCPGCYNHVTEIQALAIWISARTGERIPYSLCPKCSRTIRGGNKRRIARLMRAIESYIEYHEPVGAGEVGE